MRPFQRYVTSIMAIFTTFTLVKFSQFYSITFPGLFTKNKKRWNERKE